MVDQELLNILVCPEDKTPVTMADETLVTKLNEAIEAGTLKNRAGDLVEEKIEGALIREDGVYCYLIRDNIPIMLIDEAVALEQLQ